MELNKNNIDKLVEYINMELKKNPKATVNKLCDSKLGIKQSTFKTWAHNAGYRFDNENRCYTKDIEKNKVQIIQKDNKNIDMNKLKELIELIEPIKKVIQEYNKSKNVIEVEPAEWKPKNITEVKQKLFKIDVEVLEKWEQFVKDNKQYKVQNLISLALEEFIEKYSK